MIEPEASSSFTSPLSTSLDAMCRSLLLCQLRILLVSRVTSKFYFFRQKKASKMGADLLIVNSFELIYRLLIRAILFVFCSSYHVEKSIDTLMSAEVGYFFH